MNIIELFENAGIYRDGLKEFTFEDTIKVKQQFEIERTRNQSLDNNLETDLILAMNEFPKELLFISNHRILYNFFSRKNYSRNRFSSDSIVSVSTEQIKNFINRFLSKNLDSFYDEFLGQNRFDTIDDLLMVREYLPEQSIENLSKKVAEKLDFAIEKLDENPNLSHVSVTIEFLKYRSFYVLVSHFSSVETDKKIKTIYDKIFSLNKNSSLRIEFENPIVTSLVNYKAVDHGLNALFRKNKDRLDAENDKTYESSGSNRSSGWTVFVVIIVVIRLILMLARLGRA